jgi:hypothetical protein
MYEYNDVNFSPLQVKNELHDGDFKCPFLLELGMDANSKHFMWVAENFKGLLKIQR